MIGAGHGLMQLSIIDSIKTGLRLYRASLAPLAVSLLPLLLLKEVLWYPAVNAMPASVASLVCSPMGLAGLLFDALVASLALRQIWRRGGELGLVPVVAATKRRRLLATVLLLTLNYFFLQLAVTLGLLLLIVPGLVVMASGLLCPVYIVCRQQGPMQAIDSSIDATRNHLLPLIGLLLLFWGSYLLLVAAVDDWLAIMGVAAAVLDTALAFLVLSYFGLIVAVYVGLAASGAPNTGHAAG